MSKRKSLKTETYQRLYTAQVKNYAFAWVVRDKNEWTDGSFLAQQIKHDQKDDLNAAKEFCHCLYQPISLRIQMNNRIDTRNTADWRKLRFNSIEDCVAEVRRIMAADQKGRLGTSGNWTPGQAMAHVASWIEYAYEGFPVRRPPFFVRWILRLRLKKMLDNGMSRGVQIPGIKNGTVGMDDMETLDAANRLLAALTRLESSDEAKYDSPAFGPMSMRTGSN